MKKENVVQYEGQENIVKKKKLSENIFIVLLMFFVMLIMGSIIGAMIILPFMNVCSDNMSWILSSYMTFIGIHIVVLLYTYFSNRKVFWCYLSQLKGNNWRMLLVGYGVGFVMNGSCILIAWLHKDIYFEPGSMTVILFLTAFVTVFIQSAAEELICRGYLYFYVKNRYGHIPAILLSSLIFAVLHVGNTGVTPLALLNIALIGLFFTLCIYFFDSLWLAMAVHASWNFTQNFLFGLPNSGLVSPVSILKLKAAAESPIYDPVFGVEGTFVAAAVILLGILVMIYIAVCRKKKAIA